MTYEIDLVSPFIRSEVHAAYETEFVFQLYFGHTLPQVRMDDVFLRQFPDENYIVSKSSYNVSFTITRTSEGMH